MFSVTQLLAQLAKSGSKVNTAEIGDSKVQVPGVLNPTISIPLPVFTLFSAGQTTLNSSFLLSDRGVFNVTVGPNLCTFAPGLWEISAHSWLEEQGAVSDATSISELTYFDTGPLGAACTLNRITNKQGVSQIHVKTWRQLITAELGFTIRKNNTAGLGTGLNLANHLIIATRLF